MENKKVPLKKYNTLIVALSVAIPVMIALLFRVKLAIELPVFLPPIYATINGLTALILVVAIWAIKNGKKMLHERLIKLAILCSILFLGLYLMYHMTSDSTKYGGEGLVKYFYLFVLLTHILLSIIVIPFVLITYVRGITSDFESHKKIAKFTFPLWLYVTISGVVVYLMISPFY